MRTEPAPAALRRPTDADDFVFGNSGSGRTVRPMVRSPPSCGGTLGFDATPIDTALLPLAETPNYVQRVMENLQVYRARFGATAPTTESNLHRAAIVQSNAEPASTLSVEPSAYE
jgi:hypothetical protein